MCGTVQRASCFFLGLWLIKSKEPTGHSQKSAGYLCIYSYSSRYRVVGIKILDNGAAQMGVGRLLRGDRVALAGALVDSFGLSCC